MHKLFVENVADIYSMDHLKEQGKTFSNFPHAVEAIIVPFQKANRPSGTVVDGEKYLSCKHLLYGYEVEVCVYQSLPKFRVRYLKILSERMLEHSWSWRSQRKTRS